MKEWLQQRLVGEGPIHDALRDLVWIMPSWAPYALLVMAMLWLACLWLGRRGKARKRPRHLSTVA